jgi:hypothetical protein
MISCCRISVLVCFLVILGQVYSSIVDFFFNLGFSEKFGWRICKNVVVKQPCTIT